MSSRTLGALALLAAMLTGIAHALYYHPRLPESVASSFGAGGQPNGWMGRTAFSAFHAGMLVLVGAIFLGIGWLLPKIPSAWINLPNKDYWLVEERREASFAACQTYLSWFGAATVVFLVGIMHLVIQSNLSEGETLGSAFMILLVSYLVLTAVWTLALLRRFRKVRDAAQDAP